MAERYPTSLRALVLQKTSEPRKPVYHNVRIVEKSVPALKPGEVLVRINAAGFNHREVGSGCVDTRSMNVTFSTFL
jgi:D-arabinose 1-dehydrogenase-like Zn-dependent alcohol dehydrogenase